MKIDIDPNKIRAEDLRFLAVLADRGRMTKAAEALGVDHTTVSRRIRALEKDLGTRLIEQGNDGWELTDAGRSIVLHARSIHHAVALAANAISGVGTISGTVRLFAPDGFATYFCVPVAARLFKDYPELTVEVITGSVGPGFTSFDLCVSVGEAPQSRLFSEHLCDFDVNFYASDEYLSKYGAPETVDELEQHNLIFYVDSLQKYRDIDLQRVLSRPMVRFRSNSVFAQLEATRQGLGIGCLSKFIGDNVRDIHSVDIAALSPRGFLTLAMRKDALQRPEIALVREVLHDEVHRRRNELVARV